MTLTALAEATLLGVPVGLALGLVGGGGSILTLPILVGILGVSPRLATTASLLIVAVNASSALWVYLQIRMVEVRVAVMVAVSGIFGTALGTLFNKQVDPRLLTLTFSAFMVVIALQMLQGRGAGPQRCPERLAKVSLTRLLGVGTLTGLTTGFFGVGGGFVIVPALLSLGLCMRKAVPTSLLVIVLNSLIALALRALGGSDIPFGYALPMILGGLVGSAMAVKLAPKVSNAGLSKTFALLILGLAGYLAWSVKGSYG